MLLNIYLIHLVKDLLNNKINVEYRKLNELVYYKIFLIDRDLVLKNKEIQIYLLTNKQDNQHVLDIPGAKKIKRFVEFK